MFKIWEEIVPDCVQAVDGNSVATLSCIPAVFSNILSALLAFAGIVALTLFLIGSLKLINVGGDPKKLESAKNNYKYALLGLAIVFASFLLINVISQITGVECITKFGFGCE